MPWRFYNSLAARQGEVLILADDDPPLRLQEGQSVAVAREAGGLALVRLGGDASSVADLVRSFVRATTRADAGVALEDVVAQVRATWDA